MTETGTLPPGTTIEFEYEPKDWNESEFLNCGGYVAVVLNYNKADYIAAAIQSAYNQDFPIFELYAMDDASSDGSFDIMLSAIKDCIAKYRRKVKVVVVKNTQNQSTCGQWNIVSMLSKGKWFFMFCGDDESHIDRIKIADQIIQSHPGLLALCSNMTVKATGVPYLTGDNEKFWEWTGRDGVDLPYWYFFGCSAAWNAKLFETPLPTYNIDDHLIFMRAIVLGQYQDEVSVVWALDRITVVYNDATGVTNKLVDGEKIDGQEGWLATSWRNAEHLRRWHSLMGENLWNKVKAFDDKFGCDSRIRDGIAGRVALSHVYSHTYLPCVFYSVLLVIQSIWNTWGGARKELLREMMRVVGRYWLGKISFVMVDVAKNMLHSSRSPAH